MTLIRITPILALLFTIAACTSPLKKVAPPSLPEPLRPAILEKDDSTTLQASETFQSSELPKTRFKFTPSTLPRQSAIAALDESAHTPHFVTQAPITVNVDGLPLPAFINEIFGSLLGLSFEIEPQIQNKRELVTLRVSDPQSPAQIYRLAIQVLNNYQIATVWQGDLIRFVMAVGDPTEIPSLILEGLTLPHVPTSHRPVIQFVPLKVVKNAQVGKWIAQAFKGHKLTVQEDAERNAIILIGTPHLVRQAVKAIRVLDQPLMRGRYSLRIEPAFLTAEVLAQQLIKVLNAYGYAASSNANEGSIIILPISESNIVIAFSTDPKILTYIQEWADELDQVNLQQTESDKLGLYLYPVKNTTAEIIAGILNNLLSSFDLSSEKQLIQEKATKKGQTQKTSNIKKNKNLKLVVDSHRNVLLFTGTGEEWTRLLPILKEMDKPPKQVLIEVTIADITLSKKDERGVEWTLNKANLGGLNGTLGTMGLGAGSNGLTYALSSAANVRAILNVFTNSSRATILSTPRLMVRSGSSASINVGTEIPTLSSTTQGVGSGGIGNNLIPVQQVSYRSTGVSLSITPIVYAGRRIDLQVSQQVSQAQENTTSAISSPMIMNRQIDTQLSLSDGHTILLGGMISNNRSDGWDGIPILSDLPIIGQLFRVDKTTVDRTELVIMITPYVIDDDAEAIAITESIIQKLQLLPKSLSHTTK
ncbi:MAG: type II secretion system protein GspD [Thiomargarita sp.]|nr:type II secretion system protein GspD [Thiomargarita sp.]